MQLPKHGFESFFCGASFFRTSLAFYSVSLAFFSVSFRLIVLRNLRKENPFVAFGRRSEESLKGGKDKVPSV